jgi:hypothetical protein
MKVIELYTMIGNTELIALTKDNDLTDTEGLATSAFESFMSIGSNPEIVNDIADTFGFPLRNHGGYIIKDKTSLLEYLEFNEF